MDRNNLAKIDGQKFLEDCQTKLLAADIVGYFDVVTGWYGKYLLDATIELRRLAFQLVDELGASTYPITAEIVREARQDPALRHYFDPGKPAELLAMFMTRLNNAYINHLKCDCGMTVSVDSDSNHDNYDHHDHPIYRKWAYAHMSENYRAKLLR